MIKQHYEEIMSHKITSAEQPPICECGELLEMREERFHEVATKINKDYTLSKRKPKIVVISGGTGAEWLECPACCREYELDMYLDGKNKVIRGEYRHNI